MPVRRSRSSRALTLARPTPDLSRLFAFGFLTLVLLLVPLLARAQEHHPNLAGDARFLAAAVDTIHPMPYLHHSKAEWAAAADDLERRFPSLTVSQSVAEISRLVALLGDGHSRLDHVRLANHGQPQVHAMPGFDRRYPFVCQIFSDGVYVTRATAANAKLLGQRVVAVNGTPMAKVAGALMPYISADNEMWARYLMPEYLRSPAYLNAAGIVAKMEEPIRVTTAGANGTKREVPVAPATEDSTTVWIEAEDKLGASSPKPLSRRLEASYSFVDLASRVVYVRIHQFVDDPQGEDLAAFASRLFSHVDSIHAERLIVDVRGNGGGNNYLVQPLIHGAIASRTINRPGRLFVLTDRGTFSAAVNFTAQMERNTHALFIGEPTGSGPNACGDTKKVKLPASGLTVRISALYWQESDPRDHRQWILPDLPASPTFADFLAHRDPALDLALSYRELDALAAIPPNQHWGRASQQAKPALPSW